ncbi:membrane-bound serine protease (ClpP class) [Sporomusaceae bacterium BoRhaA]|uniref:NfeD family protein n=1 Tax=Pelorhabdus rhamnosifermentans TaxID=2772457 RepID=UPI001C061FAF|nr:NfeD family protein [Pelorhabdus rhamnosifermentans]MBU2701498.1 membrane-bound serine protease (ClpP class) [Pelorhabdus rhamnosifermentans]
MKRISVILKVFCLVMILCVPFSVVKAQGQVTVIRLNGEINPSQLALIHRAFGEATDKQSDAVLVELDTFGGLVDSATKIRDIISESPIPTICFVKNRAWSAGALIALAHGHIIMAPGSSIGAAEPIPTTEKTVAALKAEFSATADRNGRDANAAAAMVDKSLGYGIYARPGEILAFTDKQAVEAGFAEAVLPDRATVLNQYGLGQRQVDVAEMNTTEKAVGYLSDPLVKGFLVTLIFLAILTEIKTAGVGIAALMGLIAAAVLMGSQLLVGATGWMPALLFFGGAALIVLELFIPGSAIFGISGMLMMFGGLFLVLGGDGFAVEYLASSLILALVIFAFIVKKLPTSKLWSRFVLKNQAKTADGYTSSLDYSALVGKEGIAVTPLRPAGTVMIEGKQVDVVSEGQYIAVHEPIVVVSVSGRRIVVEIVSHS